LHDGASRESVALSALRHPASSKIRRIMPFCIELETAGRCWMWGIDHSAHANVIYSQIGKIIVAWGAMESCLGRIQNHLSFQYKGHCKSQYDIHKSKLTYKLNEISSYKERMDKVLAEQIIKLASGIEKLKDERHTIAHGYLSNTGRGSCFINLKNRHEVPLDNLLLLAEWSEYLCLLAHHIDSKLTESVTGERFHLPDLGNEPLPYPCG